LWIVHACKITGYPEGQMVKQGYVLGWEKVMTVRF
jgi:hypothetical protein